MVDPKRLKRLRVMQRLREDFRLFGKVCARIETKDNTVIPFEFNEAQEILDAAINKQLAEKGWVRILALKGRQQGVSTYTSVRFYQKTSLWKNRHTYILSHRQDTTDALFNMVDRLQRNNPMAPSTGAANVKTLEFDKLGSSYTVATAGSKGGGRGRTLTYFHGSEVAYWENAEAHFASSVQAVPLRPGTEIVLESTANGPSGKFYEMCQDAMRGIGDYVLVFIAWFESSEYRRDPGEGFELDNEAPEGQVSEVEYAAMFGLDNEQMAWRRGKIHELGYTRFMQEYPATVEEAFAASEKATFIDPIIVLRARKRKVIGGGPLIIGVDPAGAGGDRFSVAFRRGGKCEKVIYRDKIDAPEALAWLKQIIDDEKPARMFIDSGGLGHPLISMLKSAGPKYADIVRGINFGAKSQHKMAYSATRAGPKNRRAEMWDRLRRWLMSEEGVQIPDDDALQADITAPWVKNDLNNDLLLSSKEEMKAKGIRSPDLGDALALTFAESVYVEEDTKNKAHMVVESAMGSVAVSTGNISKFSGNAQGWMS